MTRLSESGGEIGERENGESDFVRRFGSQGKEVRVNLTFFDR